MTKKKTMMGVNIAPDNNVPLMKARRGSKWIDYGYKNDYPQDLIDIYHNRSSVHKAIINRKADMIAGRGFEEHENPQVNIFLKNIMGESLDRIAYKMAFDLEVIGGISLEVCWSEDRTSIASVAHIPYQTLRKGVEFNEWYFSGDWRMKGRSMYKPVPRVGFSFLDRYEQPKQIIVENEVQIGNLPYPQPSYSSALTSIENHWEITNFNLSDTKNGFSSSVAITFKTPPPTEEEGAEIRRGIQEEFTGTANAGRVITLFSEDPDTAPTITTLDGNNSAERFTQLRQDVMQDIFIAHEITHAGLFTVQTEGKLGGGTELMDALNMFQATYIDSKQKMIEDVFNRILDINGINETVTLKRFTLDG